ncbi:MAG: hypothetical protein GTO14_04555, partial [Anaerolineales bacterium]|nr:hypothetical protein [Anaerolineales bacterium]
HGNTVIPTRALGLLMMSGVESRRTRTAGFVMLGVGAVLVLVSFMNITITYRVIDTTFTVAAGERYSPWPRDGIISSEYDGIWYSPHGPCVLEGQVAVVEEGIHVAVHELFAQHEIEGSFVDGDFTLTVDPANPHTCYAFTFDNRMGDAESHVAFVLDETRTGSPFELLMWSSLSLTVRLIFYLLAVLLRVVLLPVGCTVIVWDFIRRRIRRRRRARLRKLALGE